MTTMRSLVLAAALLGCGGSNPTPPPVVTASPAPTPVSVVVAPDATVVDAALPLEPDPDPADPNGPAAAVPIPDEIARPPIEMIDTTITDQEVKAITGWPAAKKGKYGGSEIWVVLHTNDNDELQLSVVGDNQGIRAGYPLGKARRFRTQLTFDGNAIPARDRDGGYQGPIVFAARIHVPGRETPDQIAVFADGPTLRVARRPLGATAWKPALSVAFKKGTTFRGIGTTDPH